MSLLSIVPGLYISPLLVVSACISCLPRYLLTLLGFLPSGIWHTVLLSTTPQCAYRGRVQADPVCPWSSLLVPPRLHRQLIYTYGSSPHNLTTFRFRHWLPSAPAPPPEACRHPAAFLLVMEVRSPRCRQQCRMLWMLERLPHRMHAGTQCTHAHRDSVSCFGRKHGMLHLPRRSSLLMWINSTSQAVQTQKGGCYPS